MKINLEKLKSALIVLLLISAVLLARETGRFSQLFSSSAAISQLSEYLRSSRPGSADGGEAGGGYTCAAKPLYMAVTGAGAGHHAVKYDAEALERVYSGFSASLGEALGSAGEPVEVDETRWRAALRVGGVFFDYLTPQPLSLLANWLGTEMSGAAAGDSARRLCVCVDGEDAALYYISAEDGRFFRCGTAISPEGLLAKTAEYESGGDDFAFEMGVDYALLDPYWLKLEQLPAQRGLTASNPFRLGLEGEDVLTYFGMNPFVVTSYPEADGTEVYVEDDMMLRIDTSGLVRFLRSGAGEGTRPPELRDAVQVAAALVDSCIGAHCGEAEVSLSSIELDETAGLYTLGFHYLAGGVPVLTAEGRAAVVRISGEGLVSAELRYLSFTVGDTALLLHESQAAAIVASEGGGEPLLVYEEVGEGYSPRWTVGGG